MSQTAGALNVRIGAPVAGRALFVDRDGTLFAARGYRLLRSTDAGVTWVADGQLPESAWPGVAARSRLAARLLRRQVVALTVLDDGTRVAVGREGIFRAGRGESRFELTFRVERGSRPLHLAVDRRNGGERILFGEYGELGGEEVRIYASDDGGRSFAVAFAFPRGEIRHVHNLIPDGDRLWVLCGDYGAQAGIGSLSSGFERLDAFEWLRRGEQSYRAVGALLSRDALTYGTDSDRERNFIVRLEKESGRLTRLLEVEGSSLAATSFGPLQLIATCVEPNPQCPSTQASLYGSLDGERWARLAAYRKDAWHPTLFQFGAIVLPGSRWPEPRGHFSGQALRGFDDRLATLALAPG